MGRDIEQLKIEWKRYRESGYCKVWSSLDTELAFAEIERLEAELAIAKAAPAPLDWTRERPTEPGWYWIRNHHRHYPGTGDLHYIVNPDEWEHSDRYEWAGPIPKPLEPIEPAKSAWTPESSRLRAAPMAIGERKESQ